MREHHRRSIRLKGYDYTQAGAYFVTIVVQGRECVLGMVSDGDMILNQAGKIVQAAWEDLPRHYLHVVLGDFCVMPNHVHGIIILTDDDGSRGGSGIHSTRSSGQTMIPVSNPPMPEQTRPYKTMRRHGLPEIMRGFKSFSARRINRLQHTSGIAFWQRNYYEHIIRNEGEWQTIRLYIQNNPLQWEADNENPAQNKTVP